MAIIRPFSLIVSPMYEQANPINAIVDGKWAKFYTCYFDETENKNLLMISLQQHRKIALTNDSPLAHQDQSDAYSPD